MRVFFFNRFFHPDTSATSQIVSDLAFHLARHNHEVHAITSRTLSDQPRDETVDGFVWLNAYPARGNGRGTHPARADGRWCA